MGTLWVYIFPNLRIYIQVVIGLFRLIIGYYKDKKEFEEIFKKGMLTFWYTKIKYLLFKKYNFFIRKEILYLSVS